VLLHGYGGTHAHYCKMYKKMVEQFYILAIDLPGMGYSSKDNIKITNFEDSLEYFLLTIDAWR
jgi:pimeloyl-ACP methyl ester carboxylesterase